MTDQTKIELDICGVLSRLFYLCAIVFLCFLFPSASFAQSDTSTPVPSQSQNPEKTKRAKELWKKGNVLADKGFSDRAHEYWKVALELDPHLSQEGESTNPASNMDVDEGTAVFRTTDKKQLQRLSKLLASAKTAYDEKQFDKALQTLDKADAISSQEPPIENLREKIILENFTPDSDRPYNELVKNNFETAVSNYRNGRYEPAMKSIEQAEKMDPDNSQVHDLKKLVEKKNEFTLLGKEVTKAKSEWKDGNDEIALETLSKVLQDHPNFQPALNLQTQIKSEGINNQLSQVKNILDRAQKEEKQNKFFNAKNDYEKVLKLNPENKVALDGSERMAALVDPLPGKIKHLEVAIQNKQKEKAKVYLGEIQDLSPDNPKLELWKKEIAELKSVHESDVHAKEDETYNLGLESYRNNNFADAKKFWSETLEIDPNHQQAKHNLDRLLEEHPELK